jgi:hypothetical protein
VPVGSGVEVCVGVALGVEVVVRLGVTVSVLVAVMKTGCPCETRFAAWQPSKASNKGNIDRVKRFRAFMA